MFEVNDEVKWSSQAGGKTREKIGTIIAVVPKDKVPCFASGNGLWAFNLHQLENPHRFRYMFDSAISRDHESYLIAVKVGKTEIAKKALYWPRVKHLEMAEQLSF